MKWEGMMCGGVRSVEVGGCDVRVLERRLNTSLPFSCKLKKIGEPGNKATAMPYFPGGDFPPSLVNIYISFSLTIFRHNSQ